MKIIYLDKNKKVGLLMPSPNWKGTMEELAKKDVPTGLKFKVVEDSVIPTDFTFSDAWEVDEKDLTDGVGS